MLPIAADHIRRTSEARSALPHAPQTTETHRVERPVRARRTRLRVAHGLERLALRVTPQ